MLAGWARPLHRIGAAGLLCSLALVCGRAQTPQPPVGQAAAEIESKAVPLTFSSRVNLVSVPVVARDAAGHATGSFERQDFQLFDNGKPQIVSRFSIERFGGLAGPVQPGPAQAAPPERFVAYLFDDAHLRFEDLARARDAAWRRISSSVNPAERIAIYTTTGATALDFTSDRDKVHETLYAIHPQNSITTSAIDCPPMSIYMADLLWNKKDPTAYADAESDVNLCTHMPMTTDEADFVAENAAKMKLALADRYIRESLDTLDLLIRKMSMMAGQRTVVLVSDGFLMLDDRRQDEAATFERALRANVVINTLDARAIYVLNPVGEASEHTINSATISDKARFANEEALVDRAVMAETASATGGRFIEGTNDLDEGFARAAEAPEYIYVLGFAPENLKLDGKYHSLKVVLRNSKGIDIEARRGYYAPHYSEDSAERAKEEIQEAFFSRDEIHDIPVVMQTQFFKATDEKATVSVAAKVDVRQIPFRKEGDRNRNDLTVVSGLFDQDGNFVSGTQKVVEMRLLDATLESRLNAGLTVKTTFDVAPGNYLVRLVVRDAEGRMMAAQNGAVEIQ
jgi:VWFA-related protein